MARILLVEPYLTGSHEAWVAGWMDHSRHSMVRIGHAGRHWRWRMRGAAVTMAREVRERFDEFGPVDVVVASNMLDLAGFIGLTHRTLGRARIVQYLHENQLSYPRQPGEALDVGLAWMQWRGALAADELWWNSAFHRDAFLSGVDGLLAASPDHGHDPERAELEARSWVASPGIAFDELRRPSESAPGRLLIVSNQRWHHDKDVGAVVRAVRRLVDHGVDVDLAVMGEADGGQAAEIDPMLDGLGERVVARGHLDRRAYVDMLRQADVIVSAARGENFGIGIVEGIAAGAWPVLPRDLSYPEILPAGFHRDCLYDEGGLGRRLASTVEAIAGGRSVAAELAVAMGRYAWPVVAAQLDDRIDQLLAV